MAFIKLDAVFLKQAAIFFLKRNHSMMLCLAGDVFL